MDAIKDANNKMIEKMMTDHIFWSNNLINNYEDTCETYKYILKDFVEEAETKTDVYNVNILPRILHMK